MCHQIKEANFTVTEKEKKYGGQETRDYEHFDFYFTFILFHFILFYLSIYLLSSAF